VCCVSCRPDFLIPCYPVISTDKDIYHGDSLKKLLGDHPAQELLDYFSNDRHVTAQTPPAFLVHTSDDKVSAENSIRSYLALKKAGVPAEMHIYEEGGHGYGIRDAKMPASSWPDRCFDWMKSRGLLDKRI